MKNYFSPETPNLVTNGQFHNPIPCYQCSNELEQDLDALPGCSKAWNLIGLAAVNRKSSKTFW